MPTLLPLEVISLKGILEFLGSLAKDVALKRLLPRESTARARDALFMLNLQLNSMDESIDSFALCIQNQKVKLFTPLFKEQLQGELNHILECMVGINDALRSLDPQLSIYAPELLDSIEEFQIHEARTIDSVPSTLPILPELDDEKLESLLQEALANQAVLKRSIAQLRAFTRSELPFKETFK